MSDLKAKTPYLLLGAVVLGLDQWTKWLAETYLVPNVARQVIPGFFNLTLVENTGVAFGLFATRGDRMGTVVLTALGLVALLVVGLYFRRTPLGERSLLVALGLILGGAIGNLADRIANGGVTDFVDVYYRSYHWHTFNVADSAITIGIVLMLFDALRPRRDESEDAPSPDAAIEGPEGNR